MKTFKTFVVASALVLVAAAPSVMARPMGGDHDGMPGHRMMEMLDDVGASDSQRQQIQQIMRAAREDLKSQHHQGMALRQQQMALWSAPSIDAGAIDAVRKQQLALQQQASERMTRAMVEAGRVLTPEQRAKVAERSAKRMKRMHERMKERRGPQ
jgi:protein CpxP